MVHTETLRIVDEASPTIKSITEHLRGLEGEVKETQKSTPDAGRNLSTMFGDASHASEVAKESIGAAIGHIGAAFSSLAAGDAKGAVTGLFDAVADLSKLLDLVVPGLGAVVSSIIKIAGGLVGITVGLIQSGVEFAISSSQAKQQMLSMFDALGQGVSTGKEVDDMLSSLSDKIGISKDVLGEYTKAFAKMGVTGVDELERLTLAAASANAIVGDGGAAAFEALQKKIQTAAESGGKFKLGQKQLAQLGETGTNVAEIAKIMGMETKDLTAQLQAGSVDATKFGDALTEAVIKKGAKSLDRMALSWDSMKKRFSQAIGDMFEDLSESVDPLMKEVKGLLGVFDASTESGKAMKWAVEETFKAILGVLTQLVPLAKKFFLDLIIFALQAYIALKPTIAQVKEFLASEEGIAAMSAAWTILKTAFVALAVAVGVIVTLFAVLATATLTVGIAIWALIGGMAELALTALTTLYDVFAGAPQAAIDFVMGLVNGIVSGAGLVNEAVKSLATGALDTFTSFFQISSPSKLMMEHGANIGAGLGAGMEASTSTVQDAASTMSGSALMGALSPSDNAATAQGAAPAGKGGSPTIYVTIEGAGKSAEEITDEMVAASWERIAMQEGG